MKFAAIKTQCRLNRMGNPVRVSGQRGIKRLTPAEFSENCLLQLLPDPGCSEEERWAGPLHVAA